MPATPCPVCHKTLDADCLLPGDWILCRGCATIFQQRAGGLQPVTPDAVAALPPDDRATVRAAQQALARPDEPVTAPASDT